MEPICSMKVSYHFSVSRLVLLVSFSSSLSFSLVFIIQDSTSSKFVKFLVCLYSEQSGSIVVSRASGSIDVGRVLIGFSVGSLKLHCCRDEWERVSSAFSNPWWKELRCMVHSNENHLWNVGCSWVCHDWTSRIGERCRGSTKRYVQKIQENGL